jgi:hypothetical protein
LALAKSPAVPDVLGEPSAIPAQRARSAGPTRRATPLASCSRRCQVARCNLTHANSRRSASQRQPAADPRCQPITSALPAKGERDFQSTKWRASSCRRWIAGRPKLFAQLKPLAAAPATDHCRSAPRVGHIDQRGVELALVRRGVGLRGLGETDLSVALNLGAVGFRAGRDDPSFAGNLNPIWGEGGPIDEAGEESSTLRSRRWPRRVGDAGAGPQPAHNNNLQGFCPGMQRAKAIDQSARLIW